MTAAAPAPDDVLAKVDALGPPGTPVTTPEVAEGFDCTKRTIYNRLDSLAEDGVLQTKKVGANSRVWWRPVDVPTQRDEAQSGRERIRSSPVFDSDLVGVIVWGPDPASDDPADLVIEDANDAFLEMVGFEYEAALGTSWQTLTPEEFYAASEEHIEQVWETGSGLAYDKQYYHADGSRWWGLFESRSLTDEKFVEFVVDITDRKEATQELEREAQLDAFRVDLTDAIRPLVDPVEIQHESARVLGEQLDVAGAHYGEVLDDGKTNRVYADYSREPGNSLVGEHHLDDYGAYISEAFQVGETVVIGDYRTLSDLSVDEQELYEQTGVTAWIGVPLFKAGELSAFVAVTESEPREWTDAEVAMVKETADRTWDAVERALLEQDLRESEERLDAFVTATSDIVYRMSPDWSEMYYLEGREFIADTEESRETWLTEYIPDNEREQVTDAIEAAIETKSTFELEHQVITVDGDRGWVHSRAIPMLDDDGAITEWFGTATDITERKRRTRTLEERTAELEEARTRLKIAAEAGSVGLYTVNVDEDRMIADEYVADCYGVASDRAARGAPIDDFVEAVHDDDTERVLREFETALTETGRLETEYRVRNADGDLVWLVSRGTVEYDDAGNPRKLHGAISDITERKHREAREQFLLALSDAVRPLSNPVEVQRETARVLGEELGADRVQYGDVLEDENTNVVHVDYHRNDMDSLTGEHRLSAYGEYIAEGFRGGEPLAVDDVETFPNLSEEALEICRQAQIRAWIGVPLVKDETLKAFVSVTESTARAWTDTEVEMVEEAAERTWAAVERARAEAKLRESEAALKRLNTAVQELIDANTVTIADRVTPLVREVLDVEYASLWRYDETVGELDQVAVDAAEDVAVEAGTLPTEIHDRVWQTFVGTGIDVENNLDIPTDGSSPLRSHAFAPLGPYGVVCLGSIGADTFDERMIDLVETTAASFETAWDRADGEEALQDQNEELTRLDRLNTLIREIDQALVAADTREEIDEAVCERLADSELYAFAWIGEHDPGTDLIEPRAWAGVDSAYLEELSITVEDTPTTRDPIARVIRTGELQVVADIATDSGFAPWREATLELGARSVICIPLVYDDTVYGVLVVYADRPQSGADERNQDVLSELGVTIAHTINARETRATLQTDSVVELTLGFDECETPLCRLAREAECLVEYQGFVPRSGGDADVFFVARESNRRICRL